MAKKSKYKDPAGLKGDHAAVPNQPPFIFRNVTARIFPIKANMARLGSFVHQYLNSDIPPTIAHFRPALPYVYMIMLNYGRLEPGSVEAQNIGWISQNEFVFIIPLEWWRGDGNGRLVFHDWACTTPFIFVDSEVSLTTGREVYGWPKIKAEILEEKPQWNIDPRSPTRLLNLRTKLFPKLFSGAHEEDRELVQIYQDPPPSFSQIPLDPWNPWFPFTAMQTAASGWVGVMGNALDVIAGLPIRGYRAGRDPSSLLRMLFKAGRRASHLLPNLCRQGPRDLKNKLPFEEPELPELKLTQITLKQFYHPEKPFQACYQAIVGSDIALDTVNRVGLLGDETLLRGDPSGGFTIRIYRYDAQPIVDTLGLEALREEEGGQSGVSVSVFKPTFPFWADTDLYYGKGQVICSRPNLDDKGEVMWSPGNDDDDGKPRASWMPNTERGDRQGDSKTNCGPTPKNTTIVFKAKKEKDEAEKDKEPSIPYNTVRGGATQPIAGPFTFPDITVQVYPLVASMPKLKEYIDNYLNCPLKTLDPDVITMSFEPWGSRVYLMVSIYDDKHGKMFSENNNIGSYIEKEVAVCVPVKWYKNGKFVNWAIVSPFLFGNTGRAVISDREINGRPMVKAKIESHKDVWLTSGGPSAQRMLLKLDTEIYPGLYMAQRAEERTLIEIVEGLKEERKSDSQRSQKEINDSKLAAEEIFSKPLSVNRVHLKQHRDAHNTEDLCYQALVKTSRNITDTHEFTPIKQDIDIRIHKYPGRPIADLLGLQGGRKNSSGDSVVETFRAVDPFWMRVHVDEPLGEVVCYRLNDRPWVVFEETLSSLTNKLKNEIKDYLRPPV